jgi:NitT/TauT family transport system ATP-binding protein
VSASLTAQEVVVQFGDFHALGPISFTIVPGQLIALVGPSGCGKSTLIRAFAGLEPPTSGRVLIDDQPIVKPSPRIRLMFQSANLMPWRTVQDNIALPLELEGMGKADRYQRVAQLLPMLGLEGFETTRPHALSGGMAQRVALGRVLIQEPDVLLLDEPFGALDALTRETISMDLLAMLRQTRRTVIMVTHDINEAVLLADRVLVMSQRPGRLVTDVIITLPRPRHLAQMYQPAFAELAQTVRAGIDKAGLNRP